MVPKAARSEVLGVADNRLRLRIAAPPHEGRANEALVRFVAGLLGVAPRDVRLLAGAASRRKTLRVAGVSLEHAQRVLRL